MSILSEGQAARGDESQKVIGLWRRSIPPSIPFTNKGGFFFFQKLLADGRGKTLTKEMGLNLCAVMNILSRQGSKHFSQKPKIKQVGPQF